MLATTPTSDFRQYRPQRRDASPYTKLATPPRFANPPSAYRPPLFTPSPLKRQTMPQPIDADDVFSSPLPASTPGPTRRYSTAHPMGQQPWDNNDPDDDGYFLAPSSSHSRPLIPSSSPMPMRTPIKKPSRPALSTKPANSSATATGTKRKPPTPVVFSTPSRKRTLTPLTTAQELDDGECSALGFDRLAPLPAPRFTRTPHTKAETEFNLGHQADSMTKLRIHDRDGQDSLSGDESGYDSGSGVQELTDAGKRPAPTAKGKGKTIKLPALQPTGLNLLLKQGRITEDEVVEAISPGGHVTKRRARSRPVSAELRGSAQSSSIADKAAKASGPLPGINVTSPSTVQFPTLGMMRARRTSSSSTTSSEGSPRPRQRMPSSALPRIQTQTSNSQLRAPLSRLSSVSSATLFFGPAIPQPEKSNIPTGSGCSDVSRPARPPTASRHSHAGSTRNLPWSPGQTSDDEVDWFFGDNGPPDTSFTFSLAGDGSSPLKKPKLDVEMLAKKFRPRDSGIVLDESDGGEFFMDDIAPRASTSVSTMGSMSDGEALITPSLGPGESSGWPTVITLDSDDAFGGGTHGGTLSTDRTVDAFIMRTLTAGAKSSAKGHGEPKRVPGTPVKKIKTAQIIDRPWQSAVAHKIGFPGFDGFPNAPMGKSKPRNSLPAAFAIPSSNMTRPERARRDALAHANAPPVPVLPMEVEGDAEEEESPTTRRDTRYDGLGLGRPPAPTFMNSKGGGRMPWLTRRTSSGAFSSGSETCTSLTATPTRAAGKEFSFPTIQPASGHSTSSTSTGNPLDSPTASAVARHAGPGSVPPAPHRRGHTDAVSNVALRKTMDGLLAPSSPRPHLPAPGGFLRTRRSIAFGEEQTGRFERDFVEVDELGRGEFGRVMRARYKQGSKEAFAVKKSKRFEGIKHRRRLREEVDILKHLSQVAGARGFGKQVQALSHAHPSALGRHPNVLGYIDSWEEDETLFIQTELCELGNFSHFLWEYGQNFPRLDEARVWKIFADLSVGLEFIHDAGVIHLDLKPANIFMTGEGRFKIGDFGMASPWPRPAEPQPVTTPRPAAASGTSGFEREGDKLYLAPEVLQGKYGKAADIFSLGLTMLETATNIIVPDQGDAWHRLRHDDFCQVDISSLSPEIVDLIKSMLRSDPAMRVSATQVAGHPVVRNARDRMDRLRITAGAPFAASPLAGVPEGWLEEILGLEEGEDVFMDTGL